MNKKAISVILIVCLSVSLFAVGCSDKDAQYPTRQVEIYVPYAAGGVNDLVARLVADYVSKEWKQPIVVVNKTGSIATAKEVLKSEPDGYTALVMSIAELGASTASNSVPPVNIDEITYVARLAKFPISFTVKADAPWKDFKEFSDWAVQNTDQVTWCSVGMTSPSAFQVAEWLKVIGADFNKSRMIASTGSADGATKVAGGHAVLNTGDILGAKAMIEAGKLKSMAVSPYKNDFFPDVPVAEEYVKGLTLGNGVGLMMPKGTPDDVVKKWNDTLEKMYTDTDFQAGMKKISVMEGYMNSSDFANFVKEDVEVYVKLANEFGLKK